MKLGLTDDHIERLADGQAVRFVIPDDDRNETVVIEPADTDDMGAYANLADLMDDGDET